MELKHSATAGTMESSDILITLSPSEKWSISLHSSVEKQFGKAIKHTILETLKELGVSGCAVSAVDQGALDCVIIARTRTAACRAADVDGYFEHSAGEGA